jgi:hypothetical protein
MCLKIVVDRHRIDVDPDRDTDPTFHFDADPDSDHTSSCTQAGKSDIWFTCIHSIVSLIIFSSVSKVSYFSLFWTA